MQAGYDGTFVCLFNWILYVQVNNIMGDDDNDDELKFKDASTL